MRTSARCATITGVTAGLVGVLTGTLPFALAMEESIGLRLLYWMRGEIEPPANVIIAGVSDEAAANLGLRQALHSEIDLTGLPRTLHGEVIDVLDAAGATVIALDIHFPKIGNPDEDAALAGAMRRAGNIVLFEYLDRESSDMAGGAVPFTANRNLRIRPAPIFADAARASAPFPLPDYPILVNQLYTFMESAGDAPTLPVVAFAVYADQAHELLLAELVSLRPDLGDALERADMSRRMTLVQRALALDSATVSALGQRLTESAARGTPAALVQQARRLLELYAADVGSQYLNYYGPAQTIRTVPIDDILSGVDEPGIGWNGAAVLIGYSDPEQPKQNDVFRTFYSRPDGLHLSGVEIAATALANLIDDRILVPLTMGQHRLVLLAAGLIFGACFLARSAALAGTLFATAFSGYVLLVSVEFASSSQWWPLVVPAFVQAPVALVLGLSLLYAGARRRHAAVARGARRFLPSEIVDRITANPESAGRASELVNGICMITDIERYTAYAESLAPQALESALNEYYEALFAIVDRNGGQVTDIVGDSMVAVWRLKSRESASRMAPVRAALEIGERFSASHDSFLRTRVGLNAGEFVLGTVGAQDHLEFRAVGDVVNSAARIQNLNKRLGTTILGTHESVASAGSVWRDVGTFRLAGKRRVLEIGELLAESPDRQRSHELAAAFQAALAAFRDAELDRAQRAFTEILAAFGDDGPSRFYLEMIELRLREAGPDPSDPVIDLSH